MVRPRRAWIGLVLIVVVTACSSGGSGNDGAGAPAAGPGTRLEVSGVGAAAFSGTLACTGSRPTGTGTFAGRAEQLCRTVAAKAAVFRALGSAGDRTCAQVYGGPQHARITGTVAGRPVDHTVTRTDGCGIGDWERLEWLLGAPGG